MRRYVALLFLLGGCATSREVPCLFPWQIVPESMCLTLLVRDGLGLPTVKESHQPAAVRIALPRSLDRLTQVDMVRLGVPPGTFLDSARVAPYTASSGAWMPLRSSRESAQIIPGPVISEAGRTMLKELSEVLSRHFAESMGASAYLGQGLTVSPVINTFSGNLFVCSLDATALWQGLNVMLYRVYNGLARKPGPFGPGWSHNFMARLDFNQDQTIQYSRWDGSAFCYRPDGKGGYISPQGFDDNLERTGDGYRIEDRTGFYMDFDQTGKLIQIGNRLQYRLVLDYAGERLLAVRNVGTELNIQLPVNKEKAELVEGGPGVVFSYDEAGRITEIRSTSGAHVVYAYDQTGRLAQATSRNQQSVAYRYDGEGRLAEVRNPHAISGAGPVNVGILYDCSSRVQEVVDANGNPLMRFDYRWAVDRTTQIVLGRQDAVVTDVYDERGVLLERVEMEVNLDPLQTGMGGGRRQRLEIDADMNVTLLDRQEGDISRWTYDEQGRMIRAEDSNGYWVERTYDSGTGLVDYIREANGRWIRFVYHANKQIRELVLDDGGRYEVEYDMGGVPRDIIGADGTRLPLDLGMPSEIPKQIWDL